MENHLATQQHLQTLVTRISESEALANVQANQDTEQDRKVVSYIIHKLQAICPAWQQSLAGMGHDEKAQLMKTIKREWLNSLMAEGVNQQHIIDYALNKVKESGNPFMPTVGQFIAWCREGNMPEGTKGCLESYKEIQAYLALPLESRKLSGLNPEVYHTLHNLGDFHGFRHADKKRALEIWTQEHNRTLEDLRNGKPLAVAPPPRVAIEKTHTPLDKQKAISSIQAMRAALSK
jgi:hypothetical protein